MQCPQQEDELLCDFSCPAGCVCQGLALLCKNYTLLTVNNTQHSLLDSKHTPNNTVHTLVDSQFNQHNNQLSLSDSKHIQDSTLNRLTDSKHTQNDTKHSLSNSKHPNHNTHHNLPNSKHTNHNTQDTMSYSQNTKQSTQHSNHPMIDTHFQRARYLDFSNSHVQLQSLKNIFSSHIKPQKSRQAQCWRLLLLN